MINRDILEKSVMSKEELDEFYNSQFEPMEFPWLSNVKSWIEKNYDVKVMTIQYNIINNDTHEFTLFLYSSADWNKIPLTGGQAFWCGHCVEIENIISNYIKSNKKIRCRLSYTNFEHSAKKYLLSLLYKLDMMKNEIGALFIQLEPIYITLGNPIICVLETKEKAKIFLLSDYYTYIQKKIFGLLKSYDVYNILNEKDIRIFVDYNENYIKIPMYVRWVQEMRKDECELYEKTIIDL